MAFSIVDGILLCNCSRENTHQRQFDHKLQCRRRARLIIITLQYQNYYFLRAEKRTTQLLSSDFFWIRLRFLKVATCTLFVFAWSCWWWRAIVYYLISKGSISLFLLFTNGVSILKKVDRSEKSFFPSVTAPSCVYHHVLDFRSHFKKRRLKSNES